MPVSGFSPYRLKYAALDLENRFLTIAEDEIAERAHNEYAQILAELGIVGLGLFCLFLVGTIYAASRIWKRRHDISMPTVAAFIGVAGFLASSLVTAYSFRIFQNGLIFFLVLAIAVGGTTGSREKIVVSQRSRRLPLVVKLAATVVLLSSLVLALYCIVRVAAVHYMVSAGGQSDEVQKEKYAATALRLDSENAQFHAFIGREHLNKENATKAVIFLRNAIDRGQATSIDYSYLATAHRMNRDLAGAKQTLEEAIGLYPRSVFLRTRLGVVLSDMGDAANAEKQFEAAMALNAGQAGTWRIFVESGGRAASQNAFDTKTLAVMDLLPKKAIYAMQAERELRFPDEKFKFPQE